MHGVNFVVSGLRIFGFISVVWCCDGCLWRLSRYVRKSNF